jgi:hypothetical protein
MKRSLILIIAMLCTSCLAQMTTPTEPPLEEMPIESTEIPEEIITPDCQPASGVTFRLQKISENMVELIATGLQPGETPRVFFNSAINGNDGSGGIRDGNIIDDTGEFYLELDRLDPPDGQAAATWDIRLAHTRGVECTMITLP